MQTDAPAPEQAPEPAAWPDLILYLLGGILLFFVAGSALSLVTTVGTLADSVARYMLNIFFLAGAFYFFGILRNKVTWRQVGLTARHFKPWVIPIAAFIAFWMIPPRALLAVAAQMIFEGGFESLQYRSDILTAGGFSWPTFLITLVGVGILAPIAEELYFRGLIHSFFMQKFGFGWRVLASSLLFGLGHIDSIGAILSSLLMGVILAVTYELTRSLWMPIAIHVVTNSFAVILVFLTLALGISG